MSTSPERSGPRRKRQARVADVLRVEPLTPQMIRVVLGGPGLATFTAGEFTDHYVKLVFPPAGAAYGHPVDMDTAQASDDRTQWPLTRAYTVRAWDPDRAELTIDFVVHGDEGIAGPWAAQATPGQQIALMGPGGGYAPDASADWHLFVGDASALPAIAASLARVPEGAKALVFAEVEDPAEELRLETPGDLQTIWVHRRGTGRSEALVAAVEQADFPSGRVHAFVHGDAGFVRQVRRHLRADRGIAAASMSVSGYWRRGSTDETWRADKRDWAASVERDEAALTSSG